MSTPAADDFQTIAQRLKELEAERQAALEAEMQRADEPVPTLADVIYDGA